MDFMLNMTVEAPPVLINFRDPVLLTGSCFTEHIGNHLRS